MSYKKTLIVSLLIFLGGGPLVLFYGATAFLEKKAQESIHSSFFKVLGWAKGPLTSFEGKIKKTFWEWKLSMPILLGKYKGKITVSIDPWRFFSGTYHAQVAINFSSVHFEGHMTSHFSPWKTLFGKRSASSYETEQHVIGELFVDKKNPLAQWHGGSLHKHRSLNKQGDLSIQPQFWSKALPLWGIESIPMQKPIDIRVSLKGKDGHLRAYMKGHKSLVIKSHSSKTKTGDTLYTVKATGLSFLQALENAMPKAQPFMQKLSRFMSTLGTFKDKDMWTTQFSVSKDHNTFIQGMPIEHVLSMWNKEAS